MQATNRSTDNATSDRLETTIVTDRMKNRMIREAVHPPVSLVTLKKCTVVMSDEDMKICKASDTERHSIV